MDAEPGLSVHHCPAHSQLSLHIHRSTLIRGITSLRIIADLLSWLHVELFAIEIHDHHDSKVNRHLLTSATLVDFPEFPNVHHFIPQVLDLRPKNTTERYLHEIEDSDKWEIYVKYRKVVSQFLIHQIYQASLSIIQYLLSIYRPHPLYFTDQEHYIGLPHRGTTLCRVVRFQEHYSVPKDLDSRNSGNPGMHLPYIVTILYRSLPIL